MSHTSHRRFGRLAAGLAVAAATTATTLLGAAPAYAQASSTTATMSGTVLRVTGTSFGNVITATGGNGVVSLSNLTGAITAVAPGCTQLGAVVRCTGVGSISFSGLGGDDKFDNKTSTPATLRGGSGNDILLGGSRNDSLSGGSGNDNLVGNAGSDSASGGLGTDGCNAEIETSCES
jgi:Ca2+-binding RTX toxin-like protein